ncbi:MAG TPA: Sel1-like repeat-containing protein kinase family protein [Terracidiphilus sp.]|nr:Sel1-like repeat-containing protein kinase family protein [Terracidiphilus sp.]
MRAAELDGRTDLYAVGGVLFEMLTGQTVFEAESYEGRAEEHRNTPPKAPSSLRPEVAAWKGLDALVLRLRAKDREQRPRDVAEYLSWSAMVQYVAPPPRPATVVEPRPGWAPTVFEPHQAIVGLPSEKSLEKPEARPERRFFWIPEAVIAAVVLTVVFASWQKSQEHSSGPVIDSATEQPINGQPNQGAANTPAVQQLTSAQAALQGNTLYKQKKYQDALPLLAPACTGGDAEACDDLGMMYAYKLGVAQDVKKSAALSSRACDAGSPDGCYNLGAFYNAGTLGRIDEQWAVVLFAKSCYGGHDEACADLGKAYLQSGSKMLDVSKALAVFEKACDASLGTSCLLLGSIFEAGNQGVEQHYVHAGQLFQKLCETGNGDGCARVGDSYFTGHGVEKYDAKSDEYFKRGCSLGSTYACQTLKDSK